MNEKPIEYRIVEITFTQGAVIAVPCTMGATDEQCIDFVDHKILAEPNFIEKFGIQRTREMKVIPGLKQL